MIIAAVVLVDELDRPGRFLAARRTHPPALAGGWEFPGGKVEPGEASPAAAVREVWEELGVRVRLGERVGGDWPLGAAGLMHLYWAALEPGQPEPRPLQDHDELRWLARDQVGEVRWLPHDQPIVAHLVSLLHTPGRG